MPTINDVKHNIKRIGVKHDSARGEDRTAKQRQDSRYMPTYSKRWKSIRNRYLANNPYCKHCLENGRHVVAVDLDHINGRADRAEDYTETNYQGLCKSCHSTKTAKERVRK